MSGFRCPHCGKSLENVAGGVLCANGHRYDRSKWGYVNLLPPSRGKNHGDDRMMVRARRDFLNAGYYQTLADALCETVRTYANECARIFDAGCGEGYYTVAVKRALAEYRARIFGVDVSKVALEFAGRRDRTLDLAAASVYALPVCDHGCEMVMSVFSPLAPEEFRRILIPGGMFVEVYPLENHLFGLKRAIYDEPYRNEVKPDVLEGFALLEKREVRYTMTVTGADIGNLLRMTPYWYKTSKEGQQKADMLTTLETEAEFGIAVYRAMPDAGKGGSSDVLSGV